MTRFGWTIIGALMCIVVCALGVFMWLSGTPPQQASVALPEEPERTLDPSALAIYTSGTYGFSFFYPATATLTDAFGAAGALDWRMHAVAAGTLIASVAMDDGEARIGMSEAPDELDACLSAGTAEEPAGIARAGSTTWHVFTSSQLGTEVERDVHSYRTIYHDRCYALEAFIAPGTPVSEAAGPQLLVESFTFADVAR